jgi:hypothetical protein
MFTWYVVGYTYIIFEIYIATPITQTYSVEHI